MTQEVLEEVKIETPITEPEYLDATDLKTMRGMYEKGAFASSSVNETNINDSPLVSYEEPSDKFKQRLIKLEQGGFVLRFGRIYPPKPDCYRLSVKGVERLRKRRLI